MSKRRWTCERVERTVHKISDSEMRQRLAEILDLLLTPKSQLQRQPVFSKDIYSQNADPRLNHKRKERL